MRTVSEIDRLLAAAQKELATLDSKRAEVLEEIENLQRQRELLIQTASESLHPYSDARVSNQSTEHEKITLPISEDVSLEFEKKFIKIEVEPWK